MRKWSECRWWHVVILWIIVVSPGVASGLGAMSTSFATGEYGRQVSLFGKIAGFLLGGGVVSAITWIIFREVFAVRTYLSGTWHDSLLAVVHKKTGEAIGAGYEEVLLRPWPLPTPYRVVQYPAAMWFSCPVQAITQNPKVVPLEASIAVELPPHSHTDAWFLNYLSNSGTFDTEFRRHSFDILQHNLPQELGGRLNPFDAAANAEFSAFVIQELQNRLSIPLAVTSVHLGIHHPKNR